ncbi:MAG: chemotaxis protein CheW [Burkholderiaceae bacterium]|nr:chemotaxis protein CheW [Burkholderiaceae bacterium]
MSHMAGAGTASGGFDLSQFHSVFFEEAGENLANMEALLLALDPAQASAGDLNAIFRVAHSIKGGAATFGFADVAELTHELETLLDRLRRNELKMRHEIVDALLAAADTLKAQLACHQGVASDAPDASALIATIKRLAAGERADTGGCRLLRVRVGPLTNLAAADGLAELFRDIPNLGTLEPLEDDGTSAEGYRTFRVSTNASDDELIELFSFHVGREQIEITPLDTTAPTEGDGFGFFVDPATLPAARQQSQAPAAKPEREKTALPQMESTTLRVAVDKVDQLINLVGELVITQAMLTQQAKSLDPVQFQGLLAGIADLERNTRHLQEAVLSIRMIPMAFVFSRFPRMLRDLAAKLGKQIELRTIGEATELDKGLIEKIVDPLTHLVRNSADHGIETPAERLKVGKPAYGTITLSAAHEGGSILIEVRDDGAGLRRDKILAKARERGLPVRDDMTDAEVWALIWEPGFSTADQVSDVSGRGVGMDVVRRNIAALGGSVEIDSAPGWGTRVLVRLPLTLAIMDGMSVLVGNETYILPLAAVVESFQMDRRLVQTVAGNARVVQVRGDYLPVVALDEVLQVPRNEPRRDGILVVVEAEGARCALLLDELLGQQQVVVKNLETNYKRVPGISGATILGDGRVALIIDVAALVKRSRH